MDYLKEKSDLEVLNHYAKNLTQETWEVFAGPESLREEILDLLAIIKLMNYKFFVQHLNLSQLISNLPR